MFPAKDLEPLINETPNVVRGEHVFDRQAGVDRGLVEQAAGEVAIVVDQGSMCAGDLAIGELLAKLRCRLGFFIESPFEVGIDPRETFVDLSNVIVGTL